MDCIVVYSTSNEVNMEKVVHSVVVDVSRTSYNNKTSFFKYIFGGCSGLLYFDARKVFEAWYANYFDMVDRNKFTNLWNAMKRSL